MIEEVSPLMRPGMQVESNVCMSHAANGMQDLSMRLIDIGKSERHKLFKPMFKAKVVLKPNTPATARNEFSGLGVYRHGVGHKMIKQGISMANDTSCWIAVMRNAPGMPFIWRSGDTTASDSTAFM
mmetsp:Transcript_19060/g.54364  ORF Transcript_19060/g.54364 Transcript_19060/m.54364 type:complete len:126 (-) Transcript_19060:207-584(-)